MKKPITEMVVPTKEYISENKQLVKMNPTEYDNVYVLKYSKKVFFKYLWDETLVECRGTLVDKDMSVVSRPFTKIFNHDEPFAPKFDDDENVFVDDKINGFMACATWHNNQLIVSTTGTTWSDFAVVAKNYIRQAVSLDLFKDHPNYSFIFEICTPEDTHIVKENFGVYLLGARLKTWRNYKWDMLPEKLDSLVKDYPIYNSDISLYRPKHFTAKYRIVKNMTKHYKREGFVITSMDDLTKQVKMKSPYYLVTKFLSRLSNVNIEKLLNNPQACKEKIDEEFFDIVDYINNNFTKFTSLDSDEKIIFIEDFFDARV